MKRLDAVLWQPMPRATGQREGMAVGRVNREVGEWPWGSASACITTCMRAMSFREYVARQEAFRVLHKGALPILARINPWPTTSAHRRKLLASPTVHPRHPEEPHDPPAIMSPADSAGEKPRS